MKQIKVFSSGYTERLEMWVNDFIEHHPNVVDIQFSMSPNVGQDVPPSRYAAMIVYEEG